MLQFVVQISKRRTGWIPTSVSVSFHTSAAIFAEVNNKLISHSALNIKKQNIIVWEIFSVNSLDTFQNTLLKHPANCSAIYWITG
ncbi:MAG: hypothetical protein A3J47_00230 [Candidatus Yanofskybacteria bacterium RIFCSPHIGHO2_02_FULL_43_22]|uniref:Uncharacterized protein n=1 Tax=Candidatus Yanofskybacteria bacterium RIFCSPHIGHO2_02_FULL_43_22 TaxID=1802681 RepID=A0A1F8FRA8_9BACT|nr:MAG: hypothetical protein A3J47_00230 [Candidatus Yanofskybacteria bacterium RIFCSPHIGHO2_02_FULL_43_22]